MSEPTYPTYEAAVAEIQRDPHNASVEAQVIVIERVGRDGLRKLHDTAIASMPPRQPTTADVNAALKSGVRPEDVRVSLGGSGRTFDLNYNGSSRWKAPTQAPAPASTYPAGNNTGNIEHEFATNPVGCSPASKALLRARWGESEYRRRYQHALEASGQLHMKVTVK